MSDPKPLSSFETPDFAEIEANLHESMEQRRVVMTQIGNLMVNWGNNEGLMVKILMELLGCTLESAQIVFSTLKTTQSRIELIRSLSIQNAEGEVRKKVHHLCDRFMALTRTRNEIAHSMWHFDKKGYIRGHMNIRIGSHFKQNEIISARDVDVARMNEINNITKQLVAFNREIWAFFPELHEYMKKPLEERQEKPSQSPEET